MKILWLANVPLPEASLLMNQVPTPFGGWLINASKSISSNPNIELWIAFPQKGLRNIEVFEGEDVKYIAFPDLDNSMSLDKEEVEKNKDFNEMVELIKPDIVHIYGTEYIHTLAMVNMCRIKNIHVTIWIQGLISFIANHYMASLPTNIQSQSTFRDLLKRENIMQQQKKFVERGKYEIESLKKVEHVMGRTTWDKACTFIINPDATYYHCNEMLRTEFYQNKWSLEECEKHSIFISQGAYPLKGLHYMLEAMSLLVKNFPRAKVYIGGPDITKLDSIKSKLKITTYGKYLNELIKKYKLWNHVVFLGTLDEKQMCERYLKSNVFVCPSSIENLPNSLGEAMILGVPCISSDVGGVKDLLTHLETGFIYQSDAPYMLAHYISEVFKNEKIALEFSVKSRRKAEDIYNINENTKRLIKIYEEILES
ncbi:glycosyltransferase family 4 protein [Sporosarcina ureae]|uniref:glycosyltransferase family 4 protein n=1 Tax=Sporosarcina ureae TaxID=1571 RepID=UPI0026EBB02D|nr:glycosyltransferase [Sporosarcina ureae]